jgi:amino acid adenylation domain-containing protein
MAYKGTEMQAGYAAQEAYWRRQLTDAPVLDLPFDSPRPPVQSFIRERETLDLDATFCAELSRFCAREHVTLFTSLLTAFAVLLHRYTEQDDVIVGSLAVVRQQDGEPLGNPVALRINLAGATSVRELCRRVAHTMAEAVANSDYPFAALVNALHPEANNARAPIFQVMFLCSGTISGTPLSSALLEDVASSAASCDVVLSAFEAAGAIRISCEYDADLFEAASIQRMLGHFDLLLRGLVANPEDSIVRLPLLTDSERHQLLGEWNETQMLSLPDRCVHQLFEEQVERTPDAVAVRDENSALTYRDLNRRANQLAHYLRRLGVRPESRVGLCVERSLDMIVGLLGILKAGAAYVPLDPLYPPERLAFMLADTQAHVVLTQVKVLSRIDASYSGRYSGHIVRLDTDQAIIAAESQENPVNHLQWTNCAYVIYTSGSTGQPKGVEGLHQGVINRCQWMWETVPFEEGELCCQKTSLSFVDSVWEIFGPLLKGVPLFLIPDHVLQDPLHLVSILADQRVTRIVVVPSLLSVLLHTHGDLASQLPQLKVWISSGEALSTHLCDDFHTKLPGRLLLNLYGSSEVAADATWHNTSARQSRDSVPIGRPISNMRAYIFDRYLQPTPIGVAGELHISGPGLARAYAGDPKLTAAKFIPHPFAPPNMGGARLYKTGDRARYLPEGNIEYLGRNDHQVKVRGFRIELGEIESVLRQHPAIREAVVEARQGASGDLMLVAYVVPKPGNAAHSDELRFLLHTRLPYYMLPAAYVVLQALPLTPNGKVNRSALPPPEPTIATEAEGYVAPRTPLEHALAQMWTGLLGLERIGIHEDFMRLGGHSLLLMQLLWRVHQNYHVILPLGELFTINLTIADLARVILEKQLEQIEPDQLLSMFQEIRELSDEEAQALSMTSNRE